MTEWADLIQQAFVARYVLSQHSWHKGIKLEDCKACDTTPWRNALRHFGQGHTRPYSLAAATLPWSDHRTTLERRWRSANKSATSGVERLSSGALLADAADERSFLTRALAHVQCHAENVFDLEFEILLIQYLRVKTAVFGLLVHAPGKHGLEQFMRHFSQIKVYAPDAENLPPQPRNEPGLSVAATEYRVAPDAWFRHRHWADRGSEEDARQIQPEEWAWLIHLKRDAPGDELPLFGSSVQKLDIDGDKIIRAIESQPTTLRDLRGLDIAGVETVQPLWVAAETLRTVRRRSREVATRGARRCVLPLGLTLHVGEDFGWLTSGIRSIAEPIQWDLLQRGDRLGHAIAITVDPSKWWERRLGRVLRVKRIERLLDLAFLAECTEGRAGELAAEAWLASQMRPIVCEIWGDAEGKRSDDDLIQRVRGLWMLLGTKTARVLMSARGTYPDSAPEKWLSRYLWSRSTQARAHEVLGLKVEESIELLLVTLARRGVIHELARRQICIESNPTSNLVVAGLDAVAAQKLLHRRPTASNENWGDETLTWTISTDDPITFSTTLADEYAYAWAGMVLRHDETCGPSYARALLDEAAATSMRMKFTMPRHHRGRTNDGKRQDKNRARLD
jgi:hypothetical protein